MTQYELYNHNWEFWDAESNKYIVSVDGNLKTEVLVLSQKICLLCTGRLARNRCEFGYSWPNSDWVRHWSTGTGIVNVGIWLVSIKQMEYEDDLNNKDTVKRNV